MDLSYRRIRLRREKYIIIVMTTCFQRAVKKIGQLNIKRFQRALNWLRNICRLVRPSLHTAMKTIIAASGAVLEQNLTHAGTSDEDVILIPS